MFKSAATKIAHNSTLSSLGGNKDLKPLQDLITAEKAVLLSLQKLSADFTKSNEYLRNWGLGEGDDLGDILSTSSILLSHISSALSQFAAHEQNVREHMKAVRTREENLDDLRRRRKAVVSKADAAEKKLNKMSPEHKSVQQQTELLNSLREQIRSLDWEILTDEARLGDFKRTATKNWMMLKFGGLLEFAEKSTIAGELGRLVIDEIPLEATQPGQARAIYTGYEKTEKFTAEAQRCIAEVVFDPQPISETQLPPQAPDQSPPNSVNNYSPTRMEATRSEAPSSFSSGTAPYMAPTEPPPMVGGGFAQEPYMPPRQDYMPPDGQQQQQQPPMGNFGRFDEFGMPAERGDRFLGGGTMPSGPIRIGDDGSRIGVPQVDGGQFGSPPQPKVGGGRFATFPVRNRQGSTGGVGGGMPKAYQLRDDGPATGPGGAGAGAGSFSAEVAQALASDPNFSPPPSIQVGEAGQRPGGGYMNAAPLYDAQNYSPAGPQALPRGAAPPIQHNPWDGPGGLDVAAKGDGVSDDETQLPYAMGAAANRSDRRVHFGGEDEPMEKQDPPMGNKDSPVTPVIPPIAPLSVAKDDAKVEKKPSKPSLKRVPVPDPNMDEELARNAAAAREISREMDALSFNPPGGVPNRTPSPLEPPAPPFSSVRAPSPVSGAGAGGTPASSAESGNLAKETPSSQQMPQAASPPSPTAPLARPSISLPSRPALSAMGGSDYKTPPEYASGQSPGPGTPSITPQPSSPMTPGARTISASAFKRPQMRSPSGAEPLPGQDISPLSFKKKATLPRSPHPPRMQSQLAESSPVDANDVQQPENSNPAGPKIPDAPPTLPPLSQSPTQSEHQPPPAPPYSGAADGDPDNYDFIASYVTPYEESPRDQDFGRLGKVQVTNPGEASPGYSQGRFATNLDENLR
ncbi:hypothetical protein BD410DRAFT_792600 [Rickenella mellea]|uniref:Eisosome component PIL1-domain-containing protein n=1 Tax=Rickenella mellea TaxID=50990 RepID=A0A4Y7PUA5_9AGAM|nr:hypothetical protein BD410DRAFT_792600 [Rickenella mellea]